MKKAKLNNVRVQSVQATKHFHNLFLPRAFEEKITNMLCWEKKKSEKNLYFIFAVLLKNYSLTYKLPLDIKFVHSPKQLSVWLT